MEDVVDPPDIDDTADGGVNPGAAGGALWARAEGPAVISNAKAISTGDARRNFVITQNTPFQSGTPYRKAA